MDPNTIQPTALVFSRENRKRIAKELTDPNKYHPDDVPVSVFMVGSPGAGKTTGRVKVIFKPEETTDFAQGDILVTSMTRPEFLFLMKKASAIVTDAGGILCHAAITAREIKKPTIIGTQTATRIFKSGDMVEVDADKGTVRKLS